MVQSLFQPISLKVPAFYEKVLKGMGLVTLIDYLFYIPHSVQERRFFRTIREFKKYVNETPSTTVLGVIIADVAAHALSASSKFPSKIILKDHTDTVEVVFFNMKAPQLKGQFPIGGRVALAAHSGRYMGVPHLVHPETVLKSTQAFLLEGNDQIYPLTKGLQQNFFRRTMPGVLSKVPNVPEWDEQTVAEKEWPSWKDALKSVHEAQTSEDLSPTSRSVQRLSYDEILAQQIGFLLLKRAYQKSLGVQKNWDNEFLQTCLSKLPFELTNAQKKVLSEIQKDLETSKQMHRLIQGDVGSGKTVLALISMIMVVQNGFQTALLAPTDILARQHYANFKPFCDQFGISVHLFTGRDTPKKRKEALERLERGNIHIAIGTHALIQDSITFKQLGYVVIDEQHRFGVEQRASLTSKGANVDVLFMSATPIPRTLVLSRYSDLDISIVDEKPPGRKEIQTVVLPVEKETSLIESLDRKIRDERVQVYWVCPLVEESEVLDLKSAEDRFTHLKDALPNVKVGLIHGKMKSAEKDTIMQDFLDGKIDLLVSTTVIEVGVDVKNARIMVIEHAERFGLAQLHQLRGRVGRNDLESTCFLLYSSPLSDISKERLKVMKETNDGFVIAQKDLELRGGGDVAGIRQSGFPDYRFVDPIIHRPLFELAYESAARLLQNSSDIEDNDPLKLLLQIYRRDTVLKAKKSG
jgi:ATP-dependent DNA helicase RecG